MTGIYPLRYMRGNQRKSLKLLNSAKMACAAGDDGEDSESSRYVRSMYLNNIGCVNFRTKRYSSAALCFSRALRLCRHSPWEPAVFYNSGVQLLRLGQVWCATVRTLSTLSTQRSDQHDSRSPFRVDPWWRDSSPLTYFWVIRFALDPEALGRVGALVSHLERELSRIIIAICSLAAWTTAVVTGARTRATSAVNLHRAVMPILRGLSTILCAM